MRPNFDPREYIRQLEDGREYLDLKWRILWLRAQEPDASIESQIVVTSEDEVVCRTTISLRTGATVTAHGSASRSESDQPVEEAENRAMIRALAALGYGTEYADEDEVPVELPPAPPVNLMTARALLDRSQQREEDDSPEPPETEAEAPGPAAPDASDQTAERSPDYEPASPQPRRPAPAATGDQEAEDISWTKFWAWARPRGYRSAVELGELLNVDVLSHTPGEIRRMIKRYEMEHPPGEARE